MSKRQHWPPKLGKPTIERIILQQGRHRIGVVRVPSWQINQPDPPQVQMVGMENRTRSTIHVLHHHLLSLLFPCNQIAAVAAPKKERAVLA
jgi:hypothetical protein